MLAAIFRITGRKACKPYFAVAEVAENISMPVISTRARRQPNGSRRVQRLKHFWQSPGHNQFVDRFGRQVGDGRALGFVHGFDFVEIVVDGAPVLAVEGERLVAALTRIEDRAIHDLHAGIEPGEAHGSAAVDRHRIDQFTGSPTLQPDWPGIDALQFEVGNGCPAHFHGEMGLGRQLVASLGPHQVLPGRESLGNISAILAGADHGADSLYLGAEQDARPFDRIAIRVLHRALDGAGRRLSRRRGLGGCRRVLGRLRVLRKQRERQQGKGKQAEGNRAKQPPPQHGLG